jgi:surface polysaccharide O-acyltransferase-like enzyme
METKRLSCLDNLRSLVIFLVVVMHSNVTYSGLGGWYYKEGSPQMLDIPSLLLFGLYGSYTQAWFMGILFFLAAFFAARSLAKRGAGAFIRERLFRLGVPLLIYMFVIDPLIGYFIMDYDGIRERASLAQAGLDYLASFRWLGSTGPLWFVEALLIFSSIYAAFRAIKPAAKKEGPAPRTLTLVLLIAVIGLAAFSIRLFQPVGTSVANLQLGYFAAYIVLFVLGLHAGERGWLLSFPEKAGLRWLGWTVGLGVPLWAIMMVAGGATSGSFLFNGGMNWQSFAYAFWEAGVAVGMSIGLIVFFQRFLGGENRITRLLADNNFGVYMFHAPVLILVSLALKGWIAPMMAKHLVVAPTAFALTLALSALVLRRIPGLRSVLK